VVENVFVILFVLGGMLIILLKMVVIEGPNAIQVVRKIRGNTDPANADLGTITGDHSFDSASFANAQGRPIRNLVHASGNKEEAEFEVGLWFSESELFEYDTIHQKSMVE
jgi:nucleoside-diphosphate kinase